MRTADDIERRIIQLGQYMKSTKSKALKVKIAAEIKGLMWAMSDPIGLVEDVPPRPRRRHRARPAPQRRGEQERREMTLRELAQDWRESGGDAIDCAIMLENWIEQAEARIKAFNSIGSGSMWVRLDDAHALLGRKEKPRERQISKG